MPKKMLKCRVCGKEYEACHTLKPNLNNAFRWQEVACSPECGAIYLAEVNKARGIEDESVTETPVKRTRKKAQTPVEETQESAPASNLLF